jgi:hypothetical protein
MGKIRLHGCVRCKGDVSIDKDQYGWYENCLQCGYTRDLPDRVQTVVPNRQKEASHTQLVLVSARKGE